MVSPDFVSATPDAPPEVEPVCGTVPFGGQPLLFRSPRCRTWPQILRSGHCEIAIDGYFVFDGKLYLGRTPDEQAEIGSIIARDLPGFLARLDNGFFNVVVNDFRRAETRFVSATFGGLPLYLARSRDRLLFASTYAGLKHLVGAELVLDPVGLAELYWFGYQLGDRTSYRNVEHMPASSVLTVRWGDGAATRERYASELPRPTIPATRRAMAEYLVAAMTSAARRLHRADAAFGAKISAGMDSRLICGAWPDNKVRAYTHGYPHSAEVRLARKLAAALGMPHTVVPVEGDFFSVLHAPIFALHGITEFFHQALLPAMRTDRVELVLDGLAGDVLLGGLTLKRTTSPARQALGLAPARVAMPRSDEEVADYILSRIRVSDEHYRPLRADAVENLAQCREEVRTDMIEEVRKARGRAESFQQLYAEVMFCNRTRRHITLQGTVCRPQVETLYPFLDRQFLCLLGRIPEEWVANKRLYVEMYSHLLPAIRPVPGIFSLLPFTVPAPMHFTGRVVRYALERAGLKVSYASRGRLNPWSADGIQWGRWLAFNAAFRDGARAFMRASAVFDERAFDAAVRAMPQGPKMSGTRFMLTASYCGHFR